MSAGGDFEIGWNLLVDAEQMEVVGIGQNSLTVVRAINGTTAAIHTSGAAISRYAYPVVGEACLQQAILHFRGYSAPTGELGAASEFNQRIIGAGLHPFVRQALQPVTRQEYR